MRPYVALHRLGYQFCKCKHCKREKPVRKVVSPNTAERQIAKEEIKKELSEG